MQNLKNKEKKAAEGLFFKYRYQFTLVLCILICLWPLTFFIYIPKWDNINAYLPYRYFISDYIWSGHMPLWNSFQKLGYPAYSDLQSACWNPVFWITMLFGKYTIGSLIIELLFYYLIAGLGMFKLNNFLYKNSKTSFLISLAYALSGFMTGSSHLMVFLIGAALLPWCIYSVLQFFKTFRLKYCLLTSLFTALCFSAASPAYSIILIYIYMFIFFYFLWKNRKEAKSLKNIATGGAIIVACSILLLLPFLYSFFEFAPYFSRLGKLPYNSFLLKNPFTPAEYISFLFPYTVISKSEIFQHTDFSLRNAYIGLVGLSYLSIAFITLKSRNIFILIACSVISLILAAGDETFIYKWVYHLPGFGNFRHPSFFRSYAIFCFLLIAGFAINKSVNEQDFSKKEKFIFLGLFAIIFLAGAASFFNTSFQEIKDLIKNNLIHRQEISSSLGSTHLFFNAIILLATGAAVYIMRKIYSLYVYASLAFFTIFDLATQTWLTAASTIYYKIPFENVSSWFKNLPQEINQEFNYTAIKFLDETNLDRTEGIWMNLSTYNKTLSYVGYNPFDFKTYNEGYKNGRLKRNIENEILYFAVEDQDINKDTTIRKGAIWSAPERIKIFAGQASLNAVRVGFNEFRASVENIAPAGQLLVLNQNYHHQWKAYFNNKELEVYKINDMVMGVEIPALSEGEIRFVYESPGLIYCAGISLFSYFALLFGLFYIKRNSSYYVSPSLLRNSHS